jgi:hypothetical protein
MPKTKTAFLGQKGGFIFFVAPIGLMSNRFYQGFTNLGECYLISSSPLWGPLLLCSKCETYTSLLNDMRLLANLLKGCDEPK